MIRWTGLAPWEFEGGTVALEDGKEGAREADAWPDGVCCSTCRRLNAGGWGVSWVDRVAVGWIERQLGG